MNLVALESQLSVSGELKTYEDRSCGSRIVSELTPLEHADRVADEQVEFRLARGEVSIPDTTAA